MSKRHRWYIVAFALAIDFFIADRVTKYFAERYIAEPIEIIPGILEFTLLHNEHFLFLWKWPVWLMASVSITVIAMMIYMIWREYHHANRWHVAMLLLILAGAVSNTYDRIRFGHVIDFIHVPFWSVFNLADVYIVIGVLLLLVSTWKLDAKEAIPKNG